MSVLDVKNLLLEIEAEAPAGEDLEYDPEFGELERAARGKSEQQFGDTLVAAEAPDWQEVRSRALDLFSRTKDLRVAVHLLRALANTDGIEGVRDGLQLIRAMLAQYWETLHPLLDTNDGDDPTMRMNSLDPACRADALPAALRHAPLVSVRAFGSFCLRDILIATGEMKLPDGSDEQPPQLADIDAAFMACDLEALQATAAAVSEAIEITGNIEEILAGQAGAGNVPGFDALTDVLAEIRRAVSERLDRRGDGAAAEDGADAADSPNTGNSVSNGSGGSGAINSRDDVVRMIDRACEYYRRNEPSSPVPILLLRAKRLVSMSFMEAIRDIAPDGLSQAETIEGTADDEN